MTSTAFGTSSSPRPSARRRGDTSTIGFSSSRKSSESSTCSWTSTPLEPPTPPFGVSNGEGSIDDIAKQVGISFLVQSWYGLADKVIIGFLKLAGVPALSVECGSHGDPEISDTAYRIAMNFLRVTGAIDDGNESNGTEVRTVHVVETITKPSDEFGFGAPWKGFQQLEPGALVGRDRVTEIRVSRRCYAVLPNEDVEIGDWT